MSNCAKNETTSSYVSGELDAVAFEEFEHHLTECGECREQVEGLRRVVTSLNSIVPDGREFDVTDAVLGQLPSDAWESEKKERQAGGRAVMFPTMNLWLRVAAGLLVAVGLGILVLRTVENGGGPASYASSGQDVGSSVEWLASSQEDDGSWDPEKWQGEPEYRVALSSAALLALLLDEESREAFPERIDKAVAYLVEQQDDAGCFGARADGVMYNHGMATFALLRAIELMGSVGLKRPVEKGLEFIRSRQGTSGGWGYGADELEHANTSVTAWQVRALAEAVNLGWQDGDNALKRGLVWMAGQVDNSGNFGYGVADDNEGDQETLTAMGALCLFDCAKDKKGSDELYAKVRNALEQSVEDGERVDFYRWYFLASALSVGRTEKCDQLLGDVQRSLFDRRVESGENSGSWNPDDQWGSVGGRIYSTALATMSLEL